MKTKLQIVIKFVQSIFRRIYSEIILLYKIIKLNYLTNIEKNNLSNKKVVEDRAAILIVEKFGNLNIKILNDVLSDYENNLENPTMMSKQIIFDIKKECTKYIKRNIR